MQSEPLELLGRLARQRREFLGLNQGDLARYGGPRVSTVGKIERAEQANYPPRTQQQLENALGWRRGTVREILAGPANTWWANKALREDTERRLVEDNVPDLSRPADVEPTRHAADLTDDELLAELTYRMKRYAERLEHNDGDPAPMTTAGNSPAVNLGLRSTRAHLAPPTGATAQRPADQRQTDSGR